MKRQLFHYRGACDQWNTMYKDEHGNYFYTAPGLYMVKTTEEHAKNMAWFEINRTQKPTPTDAQVNLWIA